MSDLQGTSLSFYGRVTDDLRREPVVPGEFRMSLGAREAIYKVDGHFAFADVRPSPLPYELVLGGGLYQGRTFSKAFPGPAPVELSFDGEDEIFLVVSAVNAGLKQVSFDAIPFLPVVPAGSTVLGESGFTSTLAADLAGVDVSTAALASVTGLAPGQVVRVVRSHCLRAKPGPYYPFPAGTTVVLVRIVDGSTLQPLEGAQARLLQVNGNSPSVTSVGGLPLSGVLVTGTQRVVLGIGDDLRSLTDARGNAALYFPGQLAITSVQLELSRTGYLTQISTFTVSAGKVTSLGASLTAA